MQGNPPCQSQKESVTILKRLDAAFGELENLIGDLGTTIAGLIPPLSEEIKENPTSHPQMQAKITPYECFTTDLHSRIDGIIRVTVDLRRHLESLHQL